MFLPRVDHPFEGGLLSQDCLGFFSVVPEIRLRGNLIDRVYPFLLSLEVKAASEEARAALPGGLIVL
jgi:hypothetical protein